MKKIAVLAAALVAIMIELRQQNVRLNRDLILALTADEERQLEMPHLPTTQQIGYLVHRGDDGKDKVIEIVARIFVVNISLAVLAFVTVHWLSPLANILALVTGAVLVGILLVSFSRGRS